MIIDETARDRILTTVHLLGDVAPLDNDAETRTWWQHAVIYQVYLKSFADSSGDGDGDIAGLMSRLEYLKDLGVDALWISPWFVSPMHDGGYDVSNYFDIDPLFGTLEEAQQLIDKIHELGLRVILDLVANHCSSEHPWFKAALASDEGSREREWFHFKDGRGVDGNEPPNDWRSIFGGPAWTRSLDRDGNPGQWYLNLFDSSQPDLNWKNPEVLEQFDRILQFWFDRGVDGFRLDAVAALGKEEDFRDIGFEPDDLYRPDIWEPVPFFDAEPVHDVLRRWRRIGQQYSPEKFFVGEVVVRDSTRLARYLRRDELQSALSFDLSKIGWSADAFRQMINTLLSSCFDNHSWMTWTLSSHDEKRSVTRYSEGNCAEGEASGSIEVGAERSRAAHLLAMALPGSACIYQGEELGLREVTDIPDEDLRDPIFTRTGNRALGRDGCRVPLPWDKSAPSLGFSASQRTWLPLPKDWAEFSVATQLENELSTLRFFQDVLRLRKSIFNDVSSVTWEPSAEGVLILRRGPDFRCVVNLSGEPWKIGDDDEVLVTSAPLSDRREINVNSGAWLRSKS